jgi:DNA invertase Pin-like site-specific DNA recombinase
VADLVESSDAPENSGPLRRQKTQEFVAGGHITIAGLIYRSCLEKIMNELVPAAQYLRMSTNRQEYSLAFQQAAISSYAADHNFRIVTTYTDAGKSGLALRHRAGLSQLLKDALSGAQRFRAILVYDVSRWGRFQDSDESAHYEFICQRAGAAVHYCAETFANDGTMPSAMMKALKRAMAAEYSRELSEKVTLSMTRMVKDGLWPGAMPGYGLRRMLVSDNLTPKQLMKFGERKNLRTDRTLLVPGPPEEILVVKEIFRLYGEERRSFPYIARKLNNLGIQRHSNVGWTYQAIRQIILNEKYTGSIIWGRYTQKLRSRPVPVAREKWIVVPEAFQPIVDCTTFEAARTVWANKAWQLSDEEYLGRLRALQETTGRLNARLINESSLTPSCSAYISRFGTLLRAYELIGYRRTDTFKIRRLSNLRITRMYRSLYVRLRKLFPDVNATHESSRARPKTLRFSTGLSVAIAICHAEKTLRGEQRWRFESHHAQRSGLVTLLCFCGPKNIGIAHYCVIPSAAHIPVIALLKEHDERVASGEQLRSLREFRRVAHSLGRVSSAVPSRRFGH